jgi:hypothetical protein
MVAAMLTASAGRSGDSVSTNKGLRHMTKITRLAFFALMMVSPSLLAAPVRVVCEHLLPSATGQHEYDIVIDPELKSAEVTNVQVEV